MPYLAMIDRLREFLRDPNSALILCGYSFRDDHLNDTILQGLQYTQTAVAFALLFEELEKYHSLATKAVDHANLIVLARDGGIIGGQRVQWIDKTGPPAAKDATPWIEWLPSSNGKSIAQFALGSFGILGQFAHELAGHVRRQPEEASHV